VAELLITGASGFLGSYLMALAQELGLDALGLTHSHAMPVPGRSQAVDLRDRRALTALVRAERPKAIIHAAAISAPDYCEQHPAEADAVNVAATGAVAMAAFEISAHLTFVSTDLVFDGDKGMYTEEDQPNPVNRYALTKAQAEHLVRAASPDFAVVRPSFLYGNPLAEHHTSYSNYIENRLRQGTPTDVFTDQYRSPILVDAFARACMEVSDRGLSGVWHIAGRDTVSRADFARSLASAASLDPAPLRDTSMYDVSLPAARPRDVSLDSSKARMRLQTALPSLTDGFHFLYGKGG
jgi:dTDP-4-dehydrorhamnose reductase